MIKFLVIVSVTGLALTACSAPPKKILPEDDPVYQELLKNPPIRIPAQYETPLRIRPIPFHEDLRKGIETCYPDYFVGQRLQYRLCWWPIGDPPRQAYLAYTLLRTQGYDAQIDQSAASKARYPGGVPVTDYLPIP